MPIWQLTAGMDAQQRVQTTAADELLAAGFRPRTPAAEPGAGSGVMRAWPRLESWCSSGTLAAIAELALDLATRLPRTARALHEGIIDHREARLIADLTRVLTDEQAREVEAAILPAAGQQTTGQLRAAAGRAVLAVDPQAAVRRREEAHKDPRVRRWQEDAGTAALAGYGLPPR